MKVFVIAGIVFAGLLLAALAALGLRRVLVGLTDRRLAAYQADLLEKHYDEVQNIYRQMRGWKHDFHNHIQNIGAHLALGHTEALGAYLRELDGDLTSVDTLVRTGNIMLDAILGSKLSLAATRGIAIDATAFAPKDMAVSDVDLCVIIGNLIDNAAEACARVPDPADRFLRVYIGTFKGQLYLSVQNSMAGTAKRIGGRYATNKAGFHGFGLMRVDRTVEKYGGYVNRQSEEGVFATEILLPLKGCSGAVPPEVGPGSI